MWNNKAQTTKGNGQLAFYLLLFVFLFSCKSGKEITRISLLEKTKTERLDLIINQALPYRTFSSTLKFTMKPGEKSKSMTVNGQLKMIKDETIQLSLKMPVLGTEAFRITITPDQLIIIDRLNKQYFAESMQDIRKEASFDFDFYSFQALLSNQLYIAGKNRIDPTDYPSFQLIEDTYSVYIKNTDQYDTQYMFSSDYTNRILSSRMYKSEWNSGISCIYEDFGLIANKRLFPLTMKLDLQLPNDSISTRFSFQQITIDEDFEINYTLPAKYKQVGMKEISALLKNLL